MPRFQAHRTSILFLTSLLNTCIASPQALPSMTTTTLTSTYSYQETSEATIPPSYLEYNITYPVHAYEEPIQVSYKDVIDVSWTFVALDHPLMLQIACWTRNATSNADLGLTPPGLNQIIANITEPGATQYQVNLTAYKDYIQCEFFMYDRVNKTLTDGDNGPMSSDFRLSDKNHSAGVIWSLENPAPIVNLTATAKSAGIRPYGRKYWIHVVWAGAVMAVLVL